ncbi:MAG: hypothetical protein HZA93_10635 [Verrucomicrobia bacterium]|nr:hypothetical protein [Verrucomicrobiota bacterium]
MPSDPPVVLQLRKTAWLILGVLMAAPWIVLVVVLRDRPSTEGRPPAVKKATVVAETKAPPPDLARARPGPWGELEYFRVQVEPPEQIIVADYTRADAIRWVFKGYNDTSLAALWRQAGFDPTLHPELSDPARLQRTTDALVFLPSAQFVTDLTPAARTIIYTVLAAFPENEPQNSPYRLRNDAAATWFDDSGLPAEAIAFTRRMFYQRGADATFFSDADIVLPTLKTAGDRVRFIKTLARKTALFVQLNVAHGADIEPIANYWGHSRRAKDLRPLLQSLARRPAGGKIDLVHLLPGFARSLVFTYPLPSEVPQGLVHDCHWTSFNFFNDQIDERFGRIDYVREVLLRDYYLVSGEPMFGDIIVLVRPDTVVLHSCVHLADDLVFTKNGAEFSVPWQIATLDNVVGLYSLNAITLDVRRYRRKDR